jgi:Ca2+-binding EF-hand superfamily protein
MGSMGPPGGRMPPPGMGQQMQRIDAQHGVAFKTDLSTIGTSRSGSRLFGGGAAAGVSILDEERRLIDKVFSIVDKDNSGAVDMTELKEMFKLFGVDSHYLTSAITRIMGNVDKDFDGMISPTEFYHLLSQKFEKDDPVEEIKSVFDRMDENKDGVLKADELYKVSQMLGESIQPTEIKDMIKMFNRQYQEDIKKYEAEKKRDKTLTRPPPNPPEGLSFDDFLAVMHEEL